MPGRSTRGKGKPSPHLPLPHAPLAQGGELCRPDPPAGKRTGVRRARDRGCERTGAADGARRNESRVRRLDDAGGDLRSVRNARSLRPTDDAQRSAGLCRTKWAGQPGRTSEEGQKRPERARPDRYTTHARLSELLEAEGSRAAAQRVDASLSGSAACLGGTECSPAAPRSWIAPPPSRQRARLTRMPQRGTAGRAGISRMRHRADRARDEGVPKPSVEAAAVLAAVHAAASHGAESWGTP
jgi:hypothetical protein